MINSYSEKIERYEIGIFNLDVSPFENIAILHLRSNLEKEFENMNSDEQLKLLSIDIDVIKNARNIANHISEVYDFSTSNKPESEWWWHLDKIISGELVVKGSLFVEKDVV